MGCIKMKYLLIVLLLLVSVGVWAEEEVILKDNLLVVRSTHEWYITVDPCYVETVVDTTWGSQYIWDGVKGNIDAKWKVESIKEIHYLKLKIDGEIYRIELLK